MVSHSPEMSPAKQVGVAETCQQHTIHPDHVHAVRRHLLSQREATEIAAFFSVLSDPTRLQVVHALLCAPEGELCVCDLATGLGRDDTTISHQLRVLRNQRIVALRKVGRVAYYRLVDEHIRQLLTMSIENLGEMGLEKIVGIEKEQRG